MTKNRPDRVVYRAKTKDPMDVLEEYERKMKQYHRQLKRFVKLIAPDEDRHPMRSHIVGRSDRFIGLSTKREDFKHPPEGWRVVSRGDVLMPKRTTAAGKELYKRIEDMGKQTPPDPRSLFDGMPREFHRMDGHGYNVHEPGLEVLGGKVYVVWSIEPDGVDPKLWERVKLSTYYLAVEREEAKTGG